MPKTVTPEIERRALALFERLAEQPESQKLRTRLLKGESEAVLTRLRALEATVERAQSAIPTLIPGSADCGGVLPPPERVGAFRLIERIGQGGMGDVWLGARDDGLYEQKVAIKLIQRHALVRAASAFEDERRFLARLEHPNIARLIDGGVTEDGLPWLVMEFIEGEPIDTACSGKSDAERVRLFVKAADAVQYAHSRMIAHADLKPSNILVDSGGRVKLLDFGIAGLIDGDARSPTGSGPLTREFASPERIAGGPPAVADDVFALGKTFNLALDGSNDPELRAIMRKASAPEEGARYGSAAAMIADLDHWRMQLPVSAVPNTMRYRIDKFVGRHRKGVLATGAGFVLLSSTSLIATSSYVRAERERGVAEQRFGAVRRLSGLMLYDLYDELARQPGTVAKRAEIAKTAATYLEKLRVSREAPVDLRLETAKSYRRLAAIQGLAGTPNLGQPAEAGKSLDHAEAILRELVADDPKNAAAIAELGWLMTDRWTLLGDNGDAPKLNREARALFDRALSREPANAEARLGKLLTEKNRAYDLIWVSDKAAAAVPVAATALIELRQTRWPLPTASRTPFVEINLLNRLGDATYYAGDIPGSLKYYQDADRVIDGLIARYGAQPHLMTLKAEIAFNLSGTLGDMGGHNQEALDIARKAVLPLREILAAGPDAAAEKMLVVLYGQEAGVLDSMGQAQAALVPSAASVAIRRERLASSPGDPRRMRDLPLALAKHATFLAKAGKHAEACSAAREALSGWNAIKTARALGAFDANKNLTESVRLQRELCTA